MYENDYKNIESTNLEDLESFLQLIADLDYEMELFAIGGTAMILKNIKESTKDIDFLTTLDQEKLRELFNLAGLKEKSKSKICNIWYLNNKIRIDIFYDEFIIGIPLPDDWKELSRQIRTIGKLKIYILNWYDIIITKIARSEIRDIEDILEIIKKENIDLDKLKDRYYGLAETSLITDYDYKYKYLEKSLGETR